MKKQSQSELVRLLEVGKDHGLYYFSRSKINSSRYIQAPDGKHKDYTAIELSEFKDGRIKLGFLEEIPVSSFDYGARFEMIFEDEDSAAACIVAWFNSRDIEKEQMEDISRVLIEGLPPKERDAFYCIKAKREYEATGYRDYCDSQCSKCRD